MQLTHQNSRPTLVAPRYDGATIHEDPDQIHSSTNSILLVCDTVHCSPHAVLQLYPINNVGCKLLLLDSEVQDQGIRPPAPSCLVIRRRDDLSWLRSRYSLKTTRFIYQALQTSLVLEFEMFRVQLSPWLVTWTRSTRRSQHVTFVRCSWCIRDEEAGILECTVVPHIIVPTQFLVVVGSDRK